MYAKFKYAFLSEFMELKGGPPSPDAFSDQFNGLDSEQLAAALAMFAKTLLARFPSDQVVIDGEVLKGAIMDALRRSPLHLVRAFEPGARIALCSVDARKEIERVALTIEKVETAVEPKFQEHFVNANSFPHAVDDFSNLSAIVDLPDLNFNVTARRRQTRKRNR